MITNVMVKGEYAGFIDELYLTICSFVADNEGKACIISRISKASPRARIKAIRAVIDEYKRSE